MTAEERMSAALRMVLWGFGLAAAAIAILIALLVVNAFARDDGRYANSNLKPWFDSLKSGKGPCCSDADGSALSDTDWDKKDGFYRVHIEGQWWVVPDEAVLTQPNLYGRTMVWPIYNRGLGGVLSIDIRCFIPGMMG